MSEPATNAALPPGDGVHVEIPGRGVVELAPFGKRMLGFLIDTIILSVVMGVIQQIFFRNIFDTASCVATTSGSETTVDCPGALFNGGSIVPLYGIASLIPFLYFWIMIAVKGQTLGGMAMKIRAVRTDNGDVPGWGPAFLRWLIVAIGGLVCCIGGWVVMFSPLWDGNKRLQGWQDKVAKVYVIKDGPEF